MTELRLTARLKKPHSINDEGVLSNDNLGYLASKNETRKDEIERNLHKFETKLAWEIQYQTRMK